MSLSGVPVFVPYKTVPKGFVMEAEGTLSNFLL
ncbi:MAG: hypothetical protein RL494_581, partial [Bacteroidota bacterium]